ncbi:MAG: putative metalloprotease CJM1_0395 family protein [Candidatus Thiodiazotropha sp.]
MDLSLGALSDYQQATSGTARRTFGPESGTVANRAESDTTRETTTERPVNESGQAQRLTREEQAQVRKLQARDREVKAHEAAHRAASGGMASGGSYTYQTGPDGRSYAIGGEVSISASYSGSPEEIIRQAETIQRAALAPADPSPQDRRVASQAAAIAAQARSELHALRREEQSQTARGSGDEDSEDRANTGISRQGQRAIDAFTSIGSVGTMHSEASPIDEMI